MAGGRRKSTHVSADDFVDTGPEAAPETVREGVEAAAEAEDAPPLLPWLEAIDEDGDEKRQGASGLLGFGLAAAALVAGLGVYAFATRNPTPTDLAGPVDTETQSDVLDSREQAIEKPAVSTPVAESGGSPAGVAAKPIEAPAPRSVPTPVKTATPVSTPDPAAKAAGAPSSIQLASYYSKQRAEDYWALVSGRYKQLAALDHETVEGTVEGRTVYRLRAFGAGEAEICQRLQSQGVPCLRVGRD